MFTGIVTGIGQVHKIINNNEFITLLIKVPKGFSKNIEKGASVSVNGVCLTVKKGGTNVLEFDVIEETLKLTNLGDLSKKSKVNLERSMTASTEIGGHLVSGHIHGTGKVLKVMNKKKTKDIQIKIPSDLMQYFFYKGYIAVNGCSLTIGKVLKSSLYIHLIPETLTMTTFININKGDLVNIEIEQSTINIVETVKRVMNEKTV